jgi:aspartate/methionine/tyrosine aminotransferase
MKAMCSEYMEWAKLSSTARYNLATSGVGPFPLAHLPVDFGSLEINGPNSYGYAPLLEAIAAKSGVDADCVVTAAGASMANYLAMAALLAPGDDVLIERPGYELLIAAASNIGANIIRFDRRAEDGFAIDVDAIKWAITPRTRLIVLTNLHNPSSVHTPPKVLAAVGELGIQVLVDEVYLDALYEDAPPSAFHLGPQFVVTNSLTKMYGASGLRCGWILARPELARRMWRLNDVMGSVAPYITEHISQTAFKNLPLLRNRARAVLDADRVELQAFLSRSRAIEAVHCSPYGTTCFPRLLRGTVDQLLEGLRANETSVVPGRFFDAPGRFRIGMGVDHALFVEGLRRLESVLNGLVYS